VAVTLLIVALAGCAGPMLSGGLTARLPAGDTPRARALDSATWGLATAVGPGLAAVASLALGPMPAVLLMAAGAVLAAALVLTLPPESKPTRHVAGSWTSLIHVAQTNPLRHTFIALGLTGLGLGAMPVSTPLLSIELGQPSGSGGLLVAAYGLSSLVGSLIVAARPLPGPPARPLKYCLAAMALAVGLAAASPSYSLALAGFAGLGLVNGAYLTAVLAVCRSYAPEGGHAQVLILSSSVKITGAALAGVWSGLAAPTGGRTVLALTSLCLLAAATSVMRVAADTVSSDR
jgi:hypothetical protein